MSRCIPILVTLMLFANGSCNAGEVSGIISDLLGQPRANRKIQFEVKGRYRNTNRSFYPITESTTLTTGPKGEFRLLLPDDDSQYQKDTYEVFIIFSGEGLATVSVNFLLGKSRDEFVKADHDIKVVMRQQAYDAGSLERAAYIGPKGSFHVVGNIGTAITHRTSNGMPGLFELQFADQDQSFLYYTSVETGDKWAFARESTRTRCCNGFNVWLSLKGENAWKMFDIAQRKATGIVSVIEFPTDSMD